MPAVSRRRFLRNASVGAVAAGAVAAGGTGVFAAIGGRAGASTLALQAASDTPTLEGSGVLAHVDNAKTGEITIFVGTREVKYVNRQLAQQLLQAAQ